MTLNLSSGFDVTQGNNTVSNPWVISLLGILTGQDKEAGTYDIDVSSYLPDDGNDYEVLWVFSANDGNALIKSGDVSFGGVYNSSNPSRVSGVLPITKNRNVQYQVYTKITSAYMSFAAYRKTTNY